MGDLIDREEEHKAEIEAKHAPTQDIDVLALAGVEASYDMVVSASLHKAETGIPNRGIEKR